MENSAWPWVIAWVSSLIILGLMIVLIAKFAIDKAEAKDVPAVLAALGTMLTVLTGWLPRPRSRAGNEEALPHPDPARRPESGPTTTDDAERPDGTAAAEVAPPATAVEPFSEEAAA